MGIEVRPVDYNNYEQGRQLVQLMESYATDMMGGGESLGEDVKQRLVAEMNERPQISSAIVYVEDQPAGLINFVEGFSTFSAKPLINIHDVVVRPEFRGQGLSRRLFEYVEAEAGRRGCCKVTLEVLEFNEVACKAYKNFGYQPYKLSDEGGVAQFWQKKLS
jgi:GNAT superfamily N-acetyltransferase